MSKCSVMILYMSEVYKISTDVGSVLIIELKASLKQDPGAVYNYSYLKTARPL